MRVGDLEGWLRWQNTGGGLERLVVAGQPLRGSKQHGIGLGRLTPPLTGIPQSGRAGW